jgi:hypothetical protein
MGRCFPQAESRYAMLGDERNCCLDQGLLQVSVVILVSFFHVNDVDIFNG